MNILHRDIKPENIFLESISIKGPQIVKLGDYGLCKIESVLSPSDVKAHQR